jgi:hypothetical protein
MDMTESMLEKLTKHYEYNLENHENGGHVVCYFNELKDEKVLFEYNFPEGIFKIYHLSHKHNAIHWAYDPNKPQ